jgi:hypothetical protein
MLKRVAWPQYHLYHLLLNNLPRDLSGMSLIISKLMLLVYQTAALQAGSSAAGSAAASTLATGSVAGSGSVAVNSATGKEEC